VVLLSIYLQVFNQTVGCFKITNDLNIVISREGFLGCGEIIRLTTSKFGIFDKELIYDSNQCLRGISKIETVEFNNKQAKFLIYHNGEMDSENPYHYEIENRSVW
jgi:ABC-2 type transport system permease protein